MVEPGSEKSLIIPAIPDKKALVRQTMNTVM